MVKRFRNKVKISEVQEEFDKLVERINNLDQIITDVQGFGDDFDYSVGSPQLSPAGYTLTVGGLKTALEGADGKVIGGKAFKIDSNHIKMSTGMLITKDGGYKLPDSVLQVPNDKRTLYYNPTKGEYAWSPKGLVYEWTERDVTAGSNYSFNNDRPHLNASVLDANIYNAQPLQGGGGGSYGELNCLIKKYPSSFTQINSDGSFKITIDNYIYALLPKSIKSNDKFIIDNASYHFLKGASNYYGGREPNYLFGTLSPDGETFIPRVAMSFTSSYPAYSDGFFEFYKAPNTNNSISSSNGIRVPFNTSTGNIQVPSVAASAASTMGDFIATFTFENDEITGAPKISASIYNTSTETTTTGSVTFPIDNYENANINCLLCNSSYTGSGATLYGPTSSQIQFIQDDVTTGLNYEQKTVKVSGYITHESNHAAYKICDLNMNRDSNYTNDTLGVQCENIYGTYKIQTENRTYNGNGSYASTNRANRLVDFQDWGNLSDPNYSYEYVENTNAPKFVIPMEEYEAEDGQRPEVYYNNIRIGCNKMGHRNMDVYYPLNYFLLPKGVSNPFNYKMNSVGWNLDQYNVISTDPTQCSSQKQYNVKISKTLKQKTS